ncbi:MAG: single-strand DNA-binding protein [Solirubrobacteraceae bacterium]|nr:single-strand DNA-binding protein [Solirubrobacteraceae bacterium]
MIGTPGESPPAGAVEDALNGPQITVTGHVAFPPRLRTLASGAIVADFRIAMTPSRFDKTANAWVDLETLWFGVTCWRSLAEHAALSFHKGDRVIVTGHLFTRSWTNKQGEDRSGLEIDATSVGMDLARGPVTQLRVERPQAAPEEEETPVESNDWGGSPLGVDPTTGEIAASVPEQTAA